MVEHQRDEIVLHAELTARRSLEEYLKKKFKLVQLAVLDTNNWMAMVLLPEDTKSLRYRCTNGIIVDEATVGD